MVSCGPQSQCLLLTRVNSGRSGRRDLQVLKLGLQLTFGTLRNDAEFQLPIRVLYCGNSLASSFFAITSSSRRSRSSETSFSSCFLAFESSWTWRR